MHSKTKIVVLHMKELIYTGIFVLLGILFIVLLVMMFVPDKKQKKVDLNSFHNIHILPILPDKDENLSSASS